MSNYFKKVPNFEYVSRLPDANISDYIPVKNLFKKGALREDIFQDLAFFTKYQVQGDDRPENVAFKVYNDSSLDWLVLAANNGTARSYTALSDFLASMAELRMGKGIEQVDLAQCLLACKHDFSHGISASIVMKAKGLTAACKDLETAFVLTSVTPRYPCYSRKLIYYISQKTGYNYLIFIDKNKLQLINNFGSSQQACPALQPHPC